MAREFHGLTLTAQILSNLRRIGCPIGCALSIFGAPIPTNNFNAGMGPEPFCQCFSCSIGQQINRLLGFEVHQDGAVGVAFTFRPIVDA